MTSHAHAAPSPTDAGRSGQRAFRTLMLANAYPGRVFSFAPAGIAPAPLAAATAAACLALLDRETRTWLDTRLGLAATEFLRFETGTRLVEAPSAADFGVSLGAPGDLSAYRQGELEYPDRSATLIVQVTSLRAGVAARWSGPGVDGTIGVTIDGLSPAFWSERERCVACFPLGVDIFLTAGLDVVGLPRTTRVSH